MFTAASIVLQMENFTKQSLIVVAKLQKWDGLTQCDQPPPTALAASVRGGTGRHPRPSDRCPLCASRARAASHYG